MPRKAQIKLAYRGIRPAGSGWLIPRLANVPLSLGRSVSSAQTAPNGSIHVLLSDGRSREVDHILLGSGYQVDVARYPFMDADLVSRLDMVSAYPLLRRGLESNVSGLHFAGAPGAWSFGPLTRFVAGTWYSSTQIARAIARDKVALGTPSAALKVAARPDAEAVDAA